MHSSSREHGPHSGRFLKEALIKQLLSYCGIFFLGYFFHAYVFSTGSLSSPSPVLFVPSNPSSSSSLVVSSSSSSSSPSSSNYLRNLQSSKDGLGVFMDDHRSSSAAGSCVFDPDLLLDLALKSETDKVSSHRYDLLFTRYLSSIRCRKIRLLEIGLGCGYDKEGASVRFWSSFFPDADIHWIEYDAECVKRFQLKYPQYHFYHGDQSNASRLKEIIDDVNNQLKSKGEYYHDDGINEGMIRPFDIIIDDGGHSDKQQIVSLETLFPALKYGGYYFLEDLHCSFDPPRNKKDYYRCGKGVRDGIGPAANIITKYVELLHEETVEPIIPQGFFYHNNLFLTNVRSINCQPSLCVFEKFNAKEIQKNRPFFPPKIE